MKKVKFGIIGTGGMGRSHLSSMVTLDSVDIVALCDVNRESVESLAAEHSCRAYTDYRDLLEAGDCEAVLVATPHYQHADIGIACLDAGLHVIVEKPICVDKAEAERLIAAHRDPKQLFSSVFNLRSMPTFRKIKQLITDGELGQISRINWIVTDWFRTEFYYRSAEWRATWAGEGGGLLVNQCPHQLDMLYWLFGMPSRVRGFCHFGKWHDIEVEDDVTAYMEYANGATGVFIGSTGEFPGTNRLEISAEMGKVVLENNKLTFGRLESSVREYCRDAEEVWGRPEARNVDIPCEEGGNGSFEILKNFIDAILNGTGLIAPAKEGVYSVELANAILQSSVTDATVELPLDGRAFKETLNKLAANSTRRRPGSD